MWEQFRKIKVKYCPEIKRWFVGWTVLDYPERRQVNSSLI